MSFSITKALYEWLHEARIVSEVAAAMGKKEVTLSAELRPTTPSAKLGADELVPLFHAIRKRGYEQELEGILYQFMDGLQGREPEASPESGELCDHAVYLARSLNALFDCADRLPRTTEPEELAQFSTLLQTELLPVVLTMNRIVQSRLDAIRHGPRPAAEPGHVIPRRGPPAPELPLSEPPV